MATVDTPLRRVLGSATADRLAGLDLHTVGDLVRHYPRRYAKRGEPTELRSLREGEYATVLAEVSSVNRRPMRNRRGQLLEAVLTDGSAKLRLTFFNSHTPAARALAPGRYALASGKVRRFAGKLELAHPECLVLDDPDADADAFARTLLPIYPATKDLPSWKIAKAVAVVLDTLDVPDDPLPASIRAEHALLPLGEALERVHRPEDSGDVTAAQRRLKWDEAFVLQVALAQRRAATAAFPAVPRVPRSDGLLAEFDAMLPFQLTAGQRAVGAEIAADLAAATPMHRLLQGEVGSGKTLVALRAMLAVVDTGGQAALLAPTEVLAAQHARNVRDLLGPFGIAGELGAADDATRVVLLTGSLGAAARRAALAACADGSAGIVVGTHALLSEGVRFADLGLVVVDEQHRFGVEQRALLRERSETPPHVLVMTATPIPRTVAMTVYGDLEVSTLGELPRGRSPIATHVVPVHEKPHFLARTWQRVHEEVAAGHQVYIVVPRIGDSDGGPAGRPSSDDVADLADAGPAPDPAESGEPADGEGAPRRPAIALAEVLPMLTAGPLAGLRIAPLHGRLSPDEKDDTMRRFARGELDVLIATTVIEVGVDVPNATVMIILDADRFGISQLHQLRGRVGRGSAPGLCLLVTEAPPDTPARERLDAVAGTLDGALLADLDLEQRGEGDVLAAVQAGRSSLRFLRLTRDADVIRAARDAATALVAADPELRAEPALAREVALLSGAEYLEKG